MQLSNPNLIKNQHFLAKFNKNIRNFPFYTPNPSKITIFSSPEPNQTLLMSHFFYFRIKLLFWTPLITHNYNQQVFRSLLWPFIWLVFDLFSVYSNRTKTSKLIGYTFRKHSLFSAHFRPPNPWIKSNSLFKLAAVSGKQNQKFMEFRRCFVPFSNSAASFPFLPKLSAVCRVPPKGKWGLGGLELKSLFLGDFLCPLGRCVGIFDALWCGWIWERSEVCGDLIKVDVLSWKFFGFGNYCAFKFMRKGWMRCLCTILRGFKFLVSNKSVILNSEVFFAKCPRFKNVL